MFLSTSRATNRLIPAHQQSPISERKRLSTPGEPKLQRDISCRPLSVGNDPRSNAPLFDIGSDSDEGPTVHLVASAITQRPSSAHLRASKRLLPHHSPRPTSSPISSQSAPAAHPLFSPATSSPPCSPTSGSVVLGERSSSLGTVQVVVPVPDYEDDFEVREDLSTSSGDGKGDQEEDCLGPWATNTFHMDQVADEVPTPTWGGNDSGWGKGGAHAEDEPWTMEEPTWGPVNPGNPDALAAALLTVDPSPLQGKLMLTSVSDEESSMRPQPRAVLREDRDRDGDPTTCAGSSTYGDDEPCANPFLLKFEALHLEEILGAGGFGTVYRGRLRHSGDMIAVKVCLCQDASMVASFKREVKILSALRHEHIVLFRGACVEALHMCIVTELMSRGNLYTLLHDDEMDMSWKLRIRWARDIVRGMNYLHTLTPPVVHRDLKSPNVLVNDYFMIKLCDFGMARTKHHTMVYTKQLGGSPLWMAPECLRGEPFSEKSDVYSFGVLLWEMLTREVPWEDKEVVQLVGLVGFKAQTLPVPSLSLYPGCPELYLTLMLECWAAAGPDRPSFRQLMSAFEDMAIHAR